MKNGMLQNGAAESGMMKLMKKKKACWKYKNGMLKNGAAESGMLREDGYPVMEAKGALDQGWQELTWCL